MIIKIQVQKKVAVNLTPEKAIVCNNNGYTVQFTFDNEWSNDTVKTARFAYRKGGQNYYEDVTFSGTTVKAPALSNINYVLIGVYASNIRTTTPAIVECAKSILCGAGTHKEPTPDVYNQLVSLINAGVNANPYPNWSHLKWYVMGDSLTAQDNVFTNKRYYDFVREKTGIQVIVDGIGGTGYGAGVSNGQNFVERVKNIPDDVDVVTIFGSGNDIRYTDDSANYEIYRTLADVCLDRPGLRVIVVPPAPWKGYDKRGELWKAYCDRLQTCAVACNCRYVSDMYDCPPFDGNYEKHMEMFFTTDPEAGIHPNEAGHQAMAPYFYNALLQELALKV